MKKEVNRKRGSEAGRVTSKRKKDTNRKRGRDKRQREKLLV